MRDRLGFADADVLRIRARADAEDAVADSELRHTRSDLLDLARELDPDPTPLRAQEAGEQAPDEVLGAAEAAITARHRRGADADEHLIRGRNGFHDVLEAKDVRRPVPLERHGLHRGPADAERFLL